MVFGHLISINPSSPTNPSGEIPMSSSSSIKATSSTSKRLFLIEYTALASPSVSVPHLIASFSKNGLDSPVNLSATSSIIYDSAILLGALPLPFASTSLILEAVTLPKRIASHSGEPCSHVVIMFITNP